MYSLEKIIAHDGVTADALSEIISVLGAKKVMLEFIADGDIANRSAELSVTGAIEKGGTHRDLKLLVEDVENTNAQTIARVASKTLSAEGQSLLALDLQHFSLAEIIVDLDITDEADPAGTFTVNVYIEK